MTCPIGLPGIVGKEPEVIAAGVVAQLLRASEAGTALSEIECDIGEREASVLARRQ
jgi:xanthine/CO dehydrogenase XdhC/CoxF family maturation factor